MLWSFKEKLLLWCRRIKRGSLSNFPSLEEVTHKNESLITNVREEIINNLKILSKSFDGVGELETSEDWIINPYSLNMYYMPDNESLKDKLIELCTNRFLKMQF